MKDQFKFEADGADKAERAIEALESKIIHTLDALRTGIILFDNRGSVLTCNRRWEELYRLELESIRDYNILQDGNLQKKSIWESIQGAFYGSAGRIEENYFSPEEWGKPGRPRWTEGYCLPIFERGNTEDRLGVALFLDDITDRIMTRIEVERLQQFLSEVKSQQEDISRRLAELLLVSGRDEGRGRRGRQARKDVKSGPWHIPRREHEVFEKLAAGYSVKETAHLLGLGIKSVYTYRARLLKRLNLTSDVGLALAWRDLQRDDSSRSTPDTEIKRSRSE